MDTDECYNCEEREATENGALCEECRGDMWADRRTHHGRLDERSVEDVARANGQM